MLRRAEQVSWIIITTISPNPATPQKEHYLLVMLPMSDILDIQV